MPNSTEQGRAKHLLRALAGTEITVFYQDTDLRYRWMENPPAGWTVEDIVGKDEFGILPQAAAARAEEAKRFALETQSHQKVELLVDMPDGDRWFDLWIDPDFDDAGELQGILCFAIETTDKKRTEERLRDLLLEVSHRSRNLLSIVQSIARQTLSTPDNAESVRRFDERLRSLSASLAAVVEGQWDGATLCDLVELQTQVYSADHLGCAVQGVNPVLNPNAALHIGLALQELAVGTVRRSGAGLDAAKVSLTSVVEPSEGSTDGIIFEWREEITELAQNDNSGQQAVDSLLLNRVVPSAISGKAEIYQTQNELIYRLTVPALNFI
ncbi:HWE histidine kinase domain-containing protein [Pseudahrensia aquimaris]|uniref:histidine kinase n=1 Tax=Pseudahrensia aquimaris TaxID=744461 RepID=A0ABW3FDD2_9HYPH